MILLFSKQRLLWKLSLIVAQLILGSFLGLLILEVLFAVSPALLPRGFRVFYNFQQNYTCYDEDYLVRGIPNLSLLIDSHPEYSMHVQLNSRGFREHVDCGSVHAVVVGDSFVFGTGVNYPDTFCQQLSAETLQPWINLAIGAYGPSQYALVLERDSSNYEPRLALVMLTLNDVQDCGRYQEWLERPYPRVPTSSPIASPTSNTSCFQSCLVSLRNSHLFRLAQWHFAPSSSHRSLQKPLRYSRDSLDLEFNESLLSWIDPSQGGSPTNWKLFEQSLSRIVRWSRNRNIPLAVVIVPIKEEVYSNQRLQAGGSSTFDQQFAAFRTRLLSSCQAHELPVLDLTESMRSYVTTHREQLYYCWDGHWNPRGHRVAAQFVLQFLAQNHLALAP